MRNAKRRLMRLILERFKCMEKKNKSYRIPKNLKVTRFVQIDNKGTSDIVFVCGDDFCKGDQVILGKKGLLYKLELKNNS